MDVASPPLQSGFPNGHASPGVNGHDHLNGSSLDGPITSTPAAAPLPFHASTFREYLLALLPPVLGATPSELEDGIFSDPDFEERVTQFATQPGGPLYVAKISDELHGTPLPLHFLSRCTMLTQCI